MAVGVRRVILLSPLKDNAELLTEESPEELESKLSVVAKATSPAEEAVEPLAVV